MESPKITEIHEIHELLLNGQSRQMVKQIKKYGVFDFWPDYRNYLIERYVNRDSRYIHFTNVVISYFRLTGQ